MIHQFYCVSRLSRREHNIQYEYLHVDFEDSTIHGEHICERLDKSQIYDEGCNYHFLGEIENLKIPKGEIQN